MRNLSAPFVASDHGDVSIFESIDAMVALIEPIDALDGGHEFLDADGAALVPALTDVRASASPVVRLMDAHMYLTDSARIEGGRDEAVGFSR
jgi:hypothetical protein